MSPKSSSSQGSWEDEKEYWDDDDFENEDDFWDDEDEEFEDDEEEFEDDDEDEELEDEDEDEEESGNNSNLNNSCLQPDVDSDLDSVDPLGPILQDFEDGDLDTEESIDETTLIDSEDLLENQNREDFDSFEQGDSDPEDED